MVNKLIEFFHELKRRNVYRVATVYAITGWIIVEVTDTVFPHLGLPEWVVTTIIIMILAGFPLALILAWVYEMGPRGIIRTISEEAEDNPFPDVKKKPFTGTLTIVILSVVLVAQFIYFSFIRDRNTEPLPEKALSEKIAVSVFNNFTGDENLEALGNMASDWITSGLRELDVKTSSPETMRRYKDKVGILPDNPNGDISLRELTEAHYVVTGSYYLKGDSLQINSRLESTTSGDIVYEFPIKWGLKNEKEALILEISEMLKGYWAVKKSNRLSLVNPPKYEAYQAFLNCWMFDVDCLEKVIEIDSTFILANIYLSYMYWTLEDSLNYEKTISYVKQNLDKCTEYEMNYLSLLEYHKKGDLLKAHQSIEKNFLMDNKDIHMLHHTAYTSMELNQLRKAKELYETVLWNPEIPLANIGGNMRGAYIDILSRMGEYEKLIEFERVREKPINLNKSAHVRALIQIGQLDSVLNQLDEVNPSNLMNLAHMYNELFPDDTSNIYAPLLRKNLDILDDPIPSNGYLFWSHIHLYNWESKAYAYYLLRDYEKTEKILEELRNKQIDWKSYSKGIVLSSSMEKYIPWHMNAWLNGLLGTAYARQSKIELALNQIQLLESFRDLKPAFNNRFHFGVVSYWQARIYSVLDEKELALSSLIRANKEGRSMDYASFVFDWDLTNLKGYGPYEEFVRPK